jgi:hypothetical protein
MLLAGSTCLSAFAVTIEASSAGPSPTASSTADARPTAVATQVAAVASVDQTTPAQPNLSIQPRRPVPEVPDPVTFTIHWPSGSGVRLPAPTPAPTAPGPTAMAAAWPSAGTSSGKSQTWTYDLFDSRAQRYEEPDKTACTAASTLMMLNTIVYDGWDQSILWTPSLSFDRQEEILAFERAHMTMILSSPGSDPHGWRNALNYFGWGSMDAAVYKDTAYPTLEAGQKAVVSALALHHKPVGVLGQWGRHAQFATGYVVRGDDPSTGSRNFVVIGVFLTDPWRSARYRDEYVTRERWMWGYTFLRFAPYQETDSPYRDPIDGEIGKSEWLGKYVIVEPTR